MEKVGGEAYQKFLKKEMINLHFPFSTRVLIDKNSISGLEEIFGKVNSEKERNFWLLI